MFDVECVNGHRDERFAWRVSELPPCAQCGAFVLRVLLPSVAVRADAIPGGMVVENLAPQPIRFDSHSAKRRYLREHGIREAVKHVGTAESDKSSHTTRWT
jgi:hypothetical protein